ncbi:MAG: FAD-dependent oxidoreductase, partial [Candidatus Obscuribacter sp.]|nr:FAD-dependent oxidoreductase [Candidatus Obscuribacter sp.]
MKYFSGAQTYQILDVEAVSVQAAAADGALKSFTSPQAQEVPSLAADIAIIGGGMGGVAAALTALTADSGVSVVMTEETSWLGGQMTSQGVSALDENKWVESTGATLSYLQLRDKLRESYRQAGGLTPEAAQDPLLHPGRSWVTRLSFEPARALAVIDQTLAP